MPSTPKGQQTSPPPPQMPLQSIPREGLQAGSDNTQENASAAPAKGSRWDSIPGVSGTNRCHQKPAGIQRGGDIKKATQQVARKGGRRR